MTKRPSWIISGIWIEIVHKLKGSLDNIKCNTEWTELQQLEFDAIWDKGIFYRQLYDKVEWCYSTPKYLIKWEIRVIT